MKISIDYIKEKMYIGDKFRIISNNKDFYQSGLYNGVECEITDKLTVYSPKDFSPVIAVCVKYQPMLCYIENGIKKPYGELMVNENGEPEYWQVKLADTDEECEGYWYEIDDKSNDSIPETKYQLFISKNTEDIVHECGKCYEMLHKVDYTEMLLVVSDDFNYNFIEGEKYTIIGQNDFVEIKYKNVSYVGQEGHFTGEKGKPSLINYKFRIN